MTIDFIFTTAVSGIINGSLYALLGLAIVLIFSTTGVANFAQGELATLSGFVFLMIFMPVGAGVPFAWVATIITMAIVAVAIYVVVIRPRPAAGHLNLTVRTLGLAGLLHGVNVFVWGTNEPYRFPSLFGSETVHLGPVALSRDQLGTLAAAWVISAAFYCFFTFTSSGLAMRAVAIDREVASLQGVNVRRITVIAWIVAAVISAAVGLLAAPISFLETGLMQPYILKAFTAAIIGGMYSFPGVLAGGLLLGISEAFAIAGSSVAFREPFIFAVLLLVLLVKPTGLFAGRTIERRL